jgi:hypothetical protein
MEAGMALRDRKEYMREYMRRKRAAARQGVTSAVSANNGAEVDSDTIIAWWKDASDQERRRLLDEIGICGPDGLASALWESDDWREYIQNCVALTLAEDAEELGYWRIPEGINAHEFEEWLETNGYIDWLRSKGVEGA